MPLPDPYPRRQQDSPFHRVESLLGSPLHLFRYRELHKPSLPITHVQSSLVPPGVVLNRKWPANHLLSSVCQETTHHLLNRLLSRAEMPSTFLAHLQRVITLYRACHGSF